MHSIGLNINSEHCHCPAFLLLTELASVGNGSSFSQIQLDYSLSSIHRARAGDFWLHSDLQTAANPTANFNCNSFLCEPLLILL